MTEDQGRLSDDPEPHEDDAAGNDPLYDELVRLRGRGFRRNVTEGLEPPELVRIADAVCPNVEVDANASRLRETFFFDAQRPDVLGLTQVKRSVPCGE